MKAGMFSLQADAKYRENWHETLQAEDMASRRQNGIQEVMRVVGGAARALGAVSAMVARYQNWLEQGPSNGEAAIRTDKPDMNGTEADMYTSRFLQPQQGPAEAAAVGAAAAVASRNQKSQRCRPARQSLMDVVPVTTMERHLEQKIPPPSVPATLLVIDICMGHEWGGKQ